MTDLDRAYRVCGFNDQGHQGVHVHALGHPTEAVDLPTMGAAEAVMRSYARGHKDYQPAKFREEVKRWKSASRSA